MSPEENDIMRSVEDHYWWYQALRLHIAAVMQPVVPCFSLLDAGCGTGGMLKIIRQTFPEAELTGIDQSEYALKITAARETGATLVPGNVHSLPFADASFDFVLSLDVISAVGVDPMPTLNEAYRVLRSRGTLILNVAALKFLRGAHDQAVDVDRRFNKQQLTDLLRGAHFEVKMVDYWNATLTPPIALVRWLSRTRMEQDPRPRSDFRVIPPIMNSILQRMAALELRASRYISWPFGTSLFVIARKNG